MEDKIEFPALFKDADAASNASQKDFLNSLRLEYSLLFAAAVLSLSSLEGVVAHYIYAMVVPASAGVLIYRFWRKPEQKWYRCRAAAESVKTTTWRFAMRAAPFADDDAADRQDFGERLRQIIISNPSVGGDIVGDASNGDQITSSMIACRAMSVEDRRKFYLKERVNDQRGWYAAKALFNKRAQERWVQISLAIYTLAFGLAVARIGVEGWDIWPIEPLLVLSSAVIGWVQVKKFAELASAYSLTAHEIGTIEATHGLPVTEQELSSFVNEAEMAFSREHTQWIARQVQA